MTHEVIISDLRSVETLIFEARQIAWKDKLGDEIYGKLDNALVLVQKVGMALKLESEPPTQKAQGRG